MSRFNLLIVCISILIIYQTLFTFSVNAYQLGVSPSVIDVGELDRGSTRVLHFFVTTQSKEDIIIKLDSQSVELDYFKKPGYEKYLQNYSEQDASSWIEYINNPINLEYSPIDKDDGTINRWRKVNFILKVPEDAEPGYHAISIRPTPQIPQGYGTSFTVVGLTTTAVLVKVPGEAIRSGKILDVTNGGFLGVRLRLNTVFQNTGTVTMSTRAYRVNIYDENDEVIKELKSVYQKIKPGEVLNLESLFKPEMEPGEYKIASSVSFTTGEEFKEATVFIGQPSVKFEEPTPIEIPTAGFEWVLIPIIIVIAYLIYRRGSE
ncbi:MAG: hypothetical protein KKC05_03015 [Nanoarchaeota archaeon]|nr:hypothetical protein [Nanoarchaeota archaeon]